MMTYEKYKPSGIEWIGEVPEHWDNITLQNSADTFIDGDWIESPDISSDGIRYITTGNIGVLNYKEQGAGYITEETFKKLNCTEVFPDDILISRLNEPIGRSCIIPDLNNRIVTSVDNVIYRPIVGIFDKRYVVYQMNCYPYTINANLLARGTTMHRISRSTLGKIKLILPPLPEQEAIASYLDARCADIDKVVATQQKRIALLQELKQSEITQAVTRGLNPDARMKDSGVEWIGMVPEHWEVKKVSWLFSVGSGTTPSTSRKDYYAEEGANWLQTGDLNDGHITETSKKITDLALRECGLTIYPINSLVVAMYGATIGKVGLLDIETTTNQACCVLYNSKLDYKYSYYAFLANKPNLLIEAYGGGQPNISQEKIKRQRIACPPNDEQSEIVEYLDHRCGEIDRQIGAVTRQIELLTEYKQALITEVVTGKRKVS